MRSDYSTKQKDLIIGTIKKQSGEFTVRQVYDALDGKVGLTTVYRMIDKLIDEKLLSKNIGKDNITYYHYLEFCPNNNHFYLKCELCGNMCHVDCDCISTLAKHISKEHDFRLDKNNIIINGICKNCR